MGNIKFKDKISLEYNDLGIDNKSNNTISIGYGTTGREISIGATSESEINVGYSGKLVAYAGTGPWTTPSDIRDKTNIKPIEHASDFLLKLQPVTYVMNPRSKYIDENGNFDAEAHAAGTKKGHRRQVGFIAQDVYKALIDTYHDDNYAKVVDIANYDNPESDDDTHMMCYTSLIPFLIKAVQENEELIKELEAYLDELEKNKETTSE